MNGEEERAYEKLELLERVGYHDLQDRIEQLKSENAKLRRSLLSVKTSADIASGYVRGAIGAQLMVSILDIVDTALEDKHGE